MLKDMKQMNQKTGGFIGQRSVCLVGGKNLLQELVSHNTFLAALAYSQYIHFVINKIYFKYIHKLNQFHFSILVPKLILSEKKSRIYLKA